MYKTRNFVMEKKLASIYLDPSQPASFGGLDAVYREVKEKGKNKISRKQVQDCLSPRVDITKEVESSFPVLMHNFKQIWSTFKISADTTRDINTY